MNSSEKRDRILEELRWTVSSTCGELTAIPKGWLATTPELPLVRGLNHVRFTEPVDFDECISTADHYMRDKPFRHIVVEDESSGDVLEPLFRKQHWTVGRNLGMSLDDEPQRQVDGTVVVELDEHQMIELMRLWERDEHVGITDEHLVQLDECNKLSGRLWNEMCFGFFYGSKPVAICKLRTHLRTGWVEAVYTLPEYRGRGYARVAVTHATELARSGGFDLISSRPTTRTGRRTCMPTSDSGLSSTPGCSVETSDIPDRALKAPSRRGP
jgi:GNAT superfamily N-acetyltransferase